MHKCGESGPPVFRKILKDQKASLSQTDTGKCVIGASSGVSFAPVPYGPKGFVPSEEMSKCDSTPARERLARHAAVGGGVGGTGALKPKSETLCSSG